MRYAVRTVLFTAASVLAANAANAASNTDDNVSQGSSALAWSTRQSIVGPTSDKLGDSTLSVTVSADLDPVADTTKPLLAVDMPKGVVVQAQWVDDKTITLSVVDDGTKDATLKAEHTLAPHVTLFIDAFGFSLTYDYSAAALLPAIPGAKWTYDAAGVGTFAPWGFDKAEATVIAPALADAQLFSIPFPAIAGQPLLGGQLALNATTTPTFAYTTKSVALMSMNAITTKGGSIQIPTVDTDFLDVPAMVKGEISWQGSLLVRPSVTITSIGSFTLPVSLTLDLPVAGVDLPYSSGTTPIAVSFPSTRFHIPLPNVKVIDDKLDLGDVTVGQTTTKLAKIGNTGEMEGAMTFKSSDPQFVVVGSKVSVASKGDYALDVKFTPAKVGAQAADITVASNDPNEPSQTIHVTGNGVQVPAPPPDAPAADDQPIPRGDNGCGCRAAPTTGEVAPYALLGIVALFARRRRR